MGRRLRARAWRHRLDPARNGERIARRDCAPRRRRRARGADQAALDLHAGAARERALAKEISATSASAAQFADRDPRPCRHRASVRPAGRPDDALHHAQRARGRSFMCCAPPKAWRARTGFQIDDRQRAAVLERRAIRRHDARAGPRLPPCDRRRRLGDHRRPGRHRQELHDRGDPRSLRSGRLSRDRPGADQCRGAGHAGDGFGHAAHDPQRAVRAQQRPHELGRRKPSSSWTRRRCSTPSSWRW